MPRVDVVWRILQYDCIRVGLERKHFRTCCESLRYGMRNQVVFALRSKQETVRRISVVDS